MTDYERRELFEIYKLHSESADRVSQRRDQAHRLYVSIFVAATAFLGALLQFDVDEAQMKVVHRVAGCAGMILSISWYIIGRSYRQLNSGKFKTLHDLEENLTYAFYTREWELLGEGKDLSRYWKLTVVESALPILFFLVSLALVCFTW